MPEPLWLAQQAVIILHNRSIALHGGATGIRDLGLLSSALERPRNRFYYEQVDDVAELAATYAVAISSNHPFVDGNKRAAFQCLTLFVRQNGLRLRTPQADAALTILALAAGKLDLERLSVWVRANLGSI
jgi:death-on-curing protein